MSTSLLRIALALLLAGALLGHPPFATAQRIQSIPAPRLHTLSKTSPTWPTTRLAPTAVCSTPNLSIIDNGLISDTITLTDARAILDMNVTLSATQNGVGDWIVSLQHEASGIGTLLLNEPNRANGDDCDGDNIPNITLNDEAPGLSAQTNCVNANPAYTTTTYAPAFPLNAFDGLPIASTYRLIVEDTGGGGGTGVLQQWCLAPTGSTAVNPSLGLGRNSLFYSQLPNTLQMRSFTLTNSSLVSTTLQWSITEGATPTLLYDNGPLVTSLATGPNGADESVVQRQALGLTSLAFDIQQSAPRSAADDFTVPTAGWQVDHVVFWGYELSTGITPTLNQAFARFWQGRPGAGGSVLAGDMTTNRLQNVQFANLYRRFDNEPANTTLRPVMRSVLSTPVSLNAGTYWVEVSANGSGNFSGPYAPFVTKENALLTGNALKRDNSNWAPFLASGTNTPQGLPFQIYGYRRDIAGCAAPGDVPWLTAISPNMGSTPGDDTVLVALQTNTFGLAIGTYSATLCIVSNDPVQPLIPFTVTMQVANPNLPTLSYSPGAIAVTLPATGTLTRNIFITNTGQAGSTLTWDMLESYGSVPEPAAPDAASFSLKEDFDSVASLPAYGWAVLNRSQPLGPFSWAQGNPNTFPAHQGSASAYIGADFNSVAGNGTISNWLLTPELELRNGATFSFYTRVPSPTNYADRLEVRLSTNGASTAVGTSATSVGDFGQLLLTINPNLTLTGYPTAWTAYTLVLTNVTTPTTGRFAFRYYVTNGGPSGSNANYIGIDTVRYTQPAADCTQLTAIPWLTLSPTGGAIGADDTSAVILKFNAAGLTAGESYTGKLCLVTNDPVRWLTEIPLTLTVAPTHQFVAGPDNPIVYGLEGQIYDFQIKVTNTGNFHDTYTLSLLNTPNFVTEVPATFGPVGAGQTGIFFVQVQIPSNASPASSLASIRVSSVGNPNLQTTVNLTTIAQRAIIYLPFVGR